MIKRIFKVTIIAELRDEFESDFQEICDHIVTKNSGLISIEVGKPTQFNPDEYLMISNWVDENALIKFAGEKWGEAYIPDHMRKYSISYSVDHFLAESKII